MLIRMNILSTYNMFILYMLFYECTCGCVFSWDLTQLLPTFSSKYPLRKAFSLNNRLMNLFTKLF